MPATTGTIASATQESHREKRKAPSRLNTPPNKRVRTVRRGKLNSNLRCSESLSTVFVLSSANESTEHYALKQAQVIYVWEKQSAQELTKLHLIVWPKNAYGLTCPADNLMSICGFVPNATKPYIQNKNSLLGGVEQKWKFLKP